MLLRFVTGSARSPVSVPFDFAHAAINGDAQSVKLEFHGTDTDTDFSDAPIVQFCKCLGLHDSLSCSYSTRLHVCTRASLTDILARKARVSVKSADKSARILVRVSGSWQAERTRRLPREDPRAEVDEDVRVGVGPRAGFKEGGAGDPGPRPPTNRGPSTKPFIFVSFVICVLSLIHI